MSANRGMYQLRVLAIGAVGQAYQADKKERLRDLD